VSDGTATATATLNVTVTPAFTADPPTVGSQSGGGTGPGGTLTVTQKLTNPSSAPSDHDLRREPASGTDGC
jgi:hypothetical protein